MSIGLVEKIISKVSNLRQARVDSYRTLATALADGKETPPDRVEKLLEEAGKNLEDLHRDVALILRRRELAATIKKAENVGSELAKIAAERAAVQAEYDAAGQRYMEAMQPLEFREKEQARLSADASAAQGALANSAAPELRVESEAIDRRRAEILRERQALTGKIEKDSDTMAIDPGSENAIRRGYSHEDVTAATRARERHKNELAKLDAENTALVKRADELFAAALTP